MNLLLVGGTMMEGLSAGLTSAGSDMVGEAGSGLLVTIGEPSEFS